MAGNIRNGRTTFPFKKARQASAAERQEKYNKLSLDEKIALQDKYGYTGKQLAKLLLKKGAEGFKTLDSESADQQSVAPVNKLTQEQKKARRDAHKAARQDVR